MFANRGLFTPGPWCPGRKGLHAPLPYVLQRGEHASCPVHRLRHPSFRWSTLTKPHRRFTLVHPSGLPLARLGRMARPLLRLSPCAPHPAVTSDARRRWGRALDTRPDASSFRVTQSGATSRRTPSAVFCPNLACPDKGQQGRGNIGIHSQKERRYRCKTCGGTFAATRGTAF